MTIEDLLAAIHRDGGHHTINAGMERSIADAAQEIHRLRADAEKWATNASDGDGVSCRVAPKIWATMQTLPASQGVRARDILWCEALMKSWSDGIIDSYQMEKILKVFNERRPERQ